MKTRLSRASILVLASLVVGLSGCATTNEQLEEAMQMARQAQSEAQAAARAANDAAAAAREAASTASAAQRAAQAAQSSASQANSCCATNSEKIDRMFQESMRK